MKYENVKEMLIGQQIILYTKNYNQISSEVLAKRIGSYTATLRNECEGYENFRVRTLTIPVGLIITRVS